MYGTLKSMYLDPVKWWYTVVFCVQGWSAVVQDCFTTIAIHFIKIIVVSTRKVRLLFFLFLWSLHSVFWLLHLIRLYCNVVHTYGVELCCDIYCWKHLMITALRWLSLASVFFLHYRRCKMIKETEDNIGDNLRLVYEILGKNKSSTV